MGIYYFDGGCAWLNEVKPARIVPGHERHKWNRPIVWGKVTTCIKCGMKRCHRKDGGVVYRKDADSEITFERPACTGITTKNFINDNSPA